MNEEELENFQYRLTNMMLNTYLKITEFTNDFAVANYPENGYPVTFSSQDKCNFANEFLQNLYDTGYQVGLNILESKNQKKL